MGKKARKGLVAGVGLWMATAAFFAGWGPKAYGAKESSVIETLTVTFQTTYGEQEEIPDPEITVSGDGCSLGDVQFRTEYDKWKPGKKVRAEVTVHADGGKVFPVSLNRSKCKVTGAEFVSAKALDDDTLQVKVDYTPVTVLGNTSEAGWSKNSRMQALWKKVDYAPGYSLVLYGDNKVVKRLTVHSNTVNLAEFMKDDEVDTFYYEVKAIPVTSGEKKYLKEGEFVTSTEQEFDAGDWEEPGSGTASGGSSNGPGAGDGGSVKGNNYVMPDGSKAYNMWKKISNKWHYFDEAGNMARGWQNVGGFWYYMDGNGAMQTGWVNPDGDSWYYLTENGDMCTGWIQPVPGNWYYLDGSGRMQRGWQEVAGKRYYMDTDGKMKTGWLLDGSTWYYLQEDGSMATNARVDGWTIGADGKAWQ